MTKNEILSAIKLGYVLTWNDPNPIDENDYTITSIPSIDEEEAFIYYGIGSEAEVFISEITLSENINPDMNKFMVAVVLTETNNTIAQDSSVDEILACKDTTLYPITDYFQAQNDEEFPIHWSFLINMKTKEDWTGSNLNGIHCNK